MEADILLRSLEMKRANEQMAQDQRILRIAGRVARLGGWIVRLADNQVQWSEETTAIHEESPNYRPTVEEGIRFYAPEYRELIRQSFERCVATGEPFDVEAQIITSRGRRVWVRAFGEAVHDAVGEITHVQGAFQDISEQKAADEQIRSLGDRLMNTMESIPDGFCTIDHDWRFTYLNAAAERVLERGRGDLLGRSVWDEFSATVGSRIADHVIGAMSSGLPTLFEEFYAPLNRWFEVELFPSSEGLAVYLRDVGERRKIREALREREERLREQAALLDHAQDAILVSDLHQRVLYWNRSAERLYGWTAAEAAGRPVTELIFAETKAFRHALEVTLARGEWVGELEQRTKDGRSRIIEGHWTLVRDDHGAPKSIFVISTDITERKKLEAQFLRAQRMEGIGALASGIAHDLNNVLAPILMTVSLLVEDETDQTRRDDLLAIESSAQRGAKMVQHLLSFGRGSDGRRAPLDLGHFATEIRKMARDTFPKNVTFRLSLARELWQVSADPMQMHQVLTNLCVNARDAMPDGGTLTIALENVVIDDVYARMNPEAQPGPFVVARVEDTGMGIPPEILGQVFEPFFTTKEVGYGTGLGLSTVHAIVRNHGGFVLVSSEVGRGSCFKVHLPALEPTHVTAEGARDRPSAPPGLGELVLLVDDEEMIRSTTRRTLERHGYRVMLASNGAEAVAIFAQHRSEIAVIVTDMNMPVMDGFATIVALRMIEPKVRIIGSSGINTNANIARAKSVGVQSFVPKPYSGDTLLRVLHQVLSEPA